MDKLVVVVNAKLTLDAGCWEEVNVKGKMERIVYPPDRTMFDQILDYLESQKHLNTSGYISTRRQALVAANVCVRWGSYFAVLADRNKPLSRQLRGPGYHSISHIGDGEMARINIEASAALARWIDLYRQDEDYHTVLANRAFELLPFSTRSLSGYPNLPAFWAANKMRLKQSEYERQFPDMMRLVEAYPTRIFSNALINYSWRNGSGVENIHAGQSGNYLLRQRRIRPSDERLLFRKTALRMREGFLTLQKISEAGSDWVQQVTPFNFAASLQVTPSRWSFTEETAEFSLPEAEMGEPQRKL